MPDRSTNTFDYVSAAGDRVPGGVFDIEAHARCTPTLTDDSDQAVCVSDGLTDWHPLATGSGTAEGAIYADSTCSASSIANISYACAGDIPPIKATVKGYACREPIVEAVELKPATRALYISTRQGCVPYEPVPGVVVYDDLDAVSARRLPALRLVRAGDVH